MDVLSYTKAQEQVRGLHRYLMLGNGFSIALRPDIFTYGSLYDNADFSAAPTVPKLFEALGTQDFEIVIKHLMDTAQVVEVYRPNLPRLIRRLRADAAAIKDALVSAIAQRHPDRPYDIDAPAYAACRLFLQPFRHIYTLNYDVLLYWTLMQNEVDELDLRPDDGFRHPEDNPDEPWVSWQQAHSPTVHYLHGALHLFDAGSDIIKYTWSKTDIPIVDQIRESLAEERYPLFVAEGSSANKHSRIMHNAYLHKALRSFESCCNNGNGSLTVFGHSLAENDRHVLRLIAKGRIRKMLVSIYGDPGSAENQSIRANCEELVRRRASAKKVPELDVVYFDAQSAHVWA